jgi:hypothetical protein
MKWYLTKIVYQIICGEGKHTAQFDEQLRLVAALNEEEAFVKATKIGQQEETVFCNDQQQLVQWKFVNISDLHRISQFIHGAELYSQIKEADDGEAYCRFVNHKALAIREKYTHKLPQLI